MNVSNIYDEMKAQQEKEGGIISYKTVLLRSLNVQQLKDAQKLVQNFLNEKKCPSVCVYACPASIVSMISHCLFRDNDGKLYLFYHEKNHNSEIVRYTFFKDIDQDFISQFY